MTAEQVYQKWNDEFHLEGNNGGIQKHKHYILQMMNEYARRMCDKQKEICSEHTNEMIGNYESHGIVEQDENVLNAPYPDELQGNN